MIISGRVQNVGFRYNTRKTAENYQISGFVKNRPDGAVYVEATGNEADLDQFILWCHRGPAWARVDRVQIQNLPFQEFDGFKVR
jgi:acylphosphatase